MTSTGPLRYHRGVKFVDECSVYVRSGKGGDGCVSFLRERFRPKGGPDGGDGGRGGHVIFRADRNLHTLLDFSFQQHHRARNGQPGMGRQRYGRCAENLVLSVPEGTVLSDHGSGEHIADLERHGQEVIVARGGKGGRGNMHFKSATNQTPRRAESGESAEERRIRLTLKLVADVGLVGFPNAGKSTLVRALSAARPKVGDYPFTTLQPQLGVVPMASDGFVVADVPGLIPGAAEGAGLGHRFLRHIERVSVLAFVVTLSPEEGRDPVSDYRALVEELGRYDAGLLEKPRLLVLSQCDRPEVEELWGDAVAALAKAEGVERCVVSGVTKEGLEPLKRGLFRWVQAERGPSAAAADASSGGEARSALDWHAAPPLPGV